MSEKLETTAWDASELLDTPELIAEYLNAAIEEGDHELLMLALSNIAKAKGMTAIAQESGLSRTSLYKALTPTSKPEFNTINKVISALGLHLHVSAS
ncbi:MAG: putative addiction module antidote protein [Ghiorsea sp.]|nr:putative addiction module antidote protein [Ghiorsea sp.]